jgi:hypothetical protein
VYSPKGSPSRGRRGGGDWGESGQRQADGSQTSFRHGSEPSEGSPPRSYNSTKYQEHQEPVERLDTGIKVYSHVTPPRAIGNVYSSNKGSPGGRESWGGTKHQPYQQQLAAEGDGQLQAFSFEAEGRARDGVRVEGGGVPSGGDGTFRKVDFANVEVPNSFRVDKEARGAGGALDEIFGRGDDYSPAGSPSGKGSPERSRMFGDDQDDQDQETGYGAPVSETPVSYENGARRGGPMWGSSGRAGMLQITGSVGSMHSSVSQSRGNPLDRLQTPPIIPPSHQDMSSPAESRLLSSQSHRHSRSTGAEWPSQATPSARKRGLANVREDRGGGASAESQEDEDEVEDLELMFDPILGCYYDPATNKYYELRAPAPA